jgi:peptide chain release factor 3
MPERFALLRSTDTATYKSFGKGLTQLEEEGAIQVFYGFESTHTEPILAAVGQLQFEVVRSRLESEYNVKTILTMLPYTVIFRVQGPHEALRTATLPTNSRLVEARDGALLLLLENDWSVRLAEQWNPRLKFVEYQTEMQPVG